MTRSQLEYVMAVAHFKNFSQAAESCFVTQSTLSAMVAKFEGQIGLTLFDRKKKPIEVTPHGELVIDRIKAILREYELMDEGINLIKGYEKGHLKLACIPTIAPYLLPMLLPQLAEKFPSVTFYISEVTTERIVDQLYSGDIDVGIVSTPISKIDILEYPLYDEDFVLYDYSIKGNESLASLDEIDLKRLWLLEEGHCLRNQVESLCQLKSKTKYKSNIIYSCGSIFTLVEMVELHKGVTLLPVNSVRNTPQIDAKYVRFFQDPSPHREVGLVTHKHFIKNQMLASLEEIIKKSVNK